MTEEGKAKLEEELKMLTGPVQEELKNLLVKANEVFQQTGDESDLAIVRDRQNFNNFRIQELNERCGRAQVVKVSSTASSEVQFGSKVVLENTKRESLTLKIVGIDEANILKDQISIESPAAKHLLGKRVGEQVELHTASGKKHYTIIEISI